MNSKNHLETGKKFRLSIPGLSYSVKLPMVEVPGEEGSLEIASLNLPGLVRLNHDLGVMLAKRIREQISDFDGVVVATVVEKALPLAQGPLFKGQRLRHRKPFQKLSAIQLNRFP